MSLIVQTVYSQTALPRLWRDCQALPAPERQLPLVSPLGLANLFWHNVKMLKMPFYHFSSSQPGFTICRTCLKRFPHSLVTFRLGIRPGNLAAVLQGEGRLRAQTVQQSQPSLSSWLGFTIGLECRGEIGAERQWTSFEPSAKVSSQVYHFHFIGELHGEASSIGMRLWPSVTQASVGISGFGIVWSFPTVGAISANTQQQAYSRVSKGLYRAAASDHFQVQNPCRLLWVAVLISASSSSRCVF